MSDYAAIPVALRDLKSWLVWRLVQVPGDKKPKKVPYYTNGDVREGPQGADEPLVSFDRAVAAVGKGRYSGIGLAMLAANGIVALDFDDCVVRGVIDERVEALIEGTYSELSPSGTGVRAFFLGSVRDRKDLGGSPKVEFFSGSGYVTVTGNVTPACEMWGWGVAPLSDATLRLYRERFGDESRADDDWLLGVVPKVGLSIEKARAFVEALDPDCGYDEWLKTGQSLHHEFEGSSAALLVWQEWSRKSVEKYPGDRALSAKWESFGRYVGAPITAAWLLKHSRVAKVAARYEAVGEWKEKIAEVADDYDLREKLCPSIAKDARLDGADREILVGAVMRRLKAMDSALPIAAVRRLVASPESMVPTVRRDRPLTEFGMAERLLDQFGDSLMYVPETDCWYVWGGVVWRKVTKTEIEFYAKETVKRLVKEVDDWSDQGEFFEFCKLAQQAKMVKNMVGLAASDPRVMVPAAELDRHAGLVAVQNGVLDLDSGRLLVADPAYRLTLQMGCNYVPDAACPLFDSTALDVFGGDATLVEFFQRVVGYALTGQPKEDVMVIPFGNGSNGKSTILGAVRRVFGSYARSAEAGSFVSEAKGGGNAGGAREDLLRLQGARFVYVNEPDENAELREGSVKAMTGGDAITARGLFAKSSVEIEPTWLIVMPTNHKPIIKGSDNGIWRRLLLLPFEQNFEGRADKDPDRAEKLQAEAEGILVWMLRGMRQYAQRGLTKPDSVRKAGESYRSQMDLLADWIDQFCEVGDFQCEMSRLWLSWESYAKSNGVINYVRSNAALGRRLDSRFPLIRGTGGVRLRSGIRLRESNSDCGDWFE